MGKFILTESDKNEIRKMYGLNEQEEPTTNEFTNKKFNVNMIFGIAYCFENGLKDIFTFGININLVVSISICFAVVFQHVDKLLVIDIDVACVQVFDIGSCAGTHGNTLDTFSRNHFSFPVVLPKNQINDQTEKGNENKHQQPRNGFHRIAVFHQQHRDGRQNDVNIKYD